MDGPARCGAGHSPGRIPLGDATMAGQAGSRTAGRNAPCATPQQFGWCLGARVQWPRRRTPDAHPIRRQRDSASGRLRVSLANTGHCRTVADARSPSHGRHTDSFGGSRTHRGSDGMTVARSHPAGRLQRGGQWLANTAHDKRPRARGARRHQPPPVPAPPELLADALERRPRASVGRQSGQTGSRVARANAGHT